MNLENHRNRLLDDSIIRNYRLSKQLCEAGWSFQVEKCRWPTKLTILLRRHRRGRQTRAVIFGASRLCFAKIFGKWWLKVSDLMKNKDIEGNDTPTNFFFSMELSAFKLAMWLCSLLFSLDCNSNLHSRISSVIFPFLGQLMMIIRLTCDRIPSSVPLSFLQCQFVFASHNHASFPPKCERHLTSFGRFSQ